MSLAKNIFSGIACTFSNTCRGVPKYIKDEAQASQRHPMKYEYKQFTANHTKYIPRHTIIDALNNDTYIIDDMISQSNTDYISMDTRINTLFNLTTKINLRDRDEQRFNTNYILSACTPQEIKTIIPALLVLSRDLKNILKNNTDILNEMNDVSYMNFAFHIILKGRDFYYAVCADTDICLYLWPNLYHDNIISIIKEDTGIDIMDYVENIKELDNMEDLPIV